MATETPTRNGAEARETQGIAALQKERARNRDRRNEAENNFRNLLHISLKALFWPPRYGKSVFGPPHTWLLPHHEYSELTILDLWKPLRMAIWFRDVSVPAFTEEPPDRVRTFLPPAVHDLFWRPTTFFQQPDPFDSVTSFPRERWFYINGILWNEDITRMNSVLLSRMFHRPLTVIHNPTASFLLDIHECAVGKAFKTRPRLSRPGTMTEPALKATQAILGALREPDLDKVVVLAYSQGTIIMANVLRAIKRALDLSAAFEKAPKTARTASTKVETDFTRKARAGVNMLLDEIVGPARNEPMQALRSTLADEFVHFHRCVQKHETDARKQHPLKKLEVYTFANCADRMQYVGVDKTDSQPYPRLEHFANEHDLVARLGILSPSFDPLDEDALVHIDGPVYERLDTWGHLLNEHYLYTIDGHLSGEGPCANPYPLQATYRLEYPEKPRLYGYFRGEKPDEPGAEKRSQ